MHTKKSHKKLGRQIILCLGIKFFLLSILWYLCFKNPINDLQAKSHIASLFQSIVEQKKL